MYQSKSRVFWVIVPSITLLILGATWAIWNWYHLVFTFLDKDKGKDSDEKKAGSPIVLDL